MAILDTPLDTTAVLSNPAVAFTLRAALGSYVLWMARGFYADPFGYFRKWMPRMPEYGWMRLAIRAGACFCIWGGCFIVATAIATQIFELHGMPLAIALILLAAIATWFLLPRPSGSLTEDESGNDNFGRMK
jgi:hypothetical protein